MLGIASVVYRTTLNHNLIAQNLLDSRTRMRWFLQIGLQVFAVLSNLESQRPHFWTVVTFSIKRLHAVLIRKPLEQISPMSYRLKK
jgi:hypothetical protein